MSKFEKTNKKDEAIKVLILMTGSIACYKVCHLISKMIQMEWQVQVAATPHTLHFVGRSTIEGLTGNILHLDLWEKGESMKHIDLIRWADLVLMAPATANSINKLAHGISDNLVTSLFLAHDFEKPFIIAPAMNRSMYEHPITQKSMGDLQDLGIHILDTESGPLACGEEGWGRLMNPELILESLVSILQNFPSSENESSDPQAPLQFKESLTKSSHSHPKKQVSRKYGNRKQILITSGATIEPLDDVRVLTNLSTGKTGSILADQFSEKGHAVYYLQGKDAQSPLWKCRKDSFLDFQDLKNKLKAILESEHFDLCIHVAAVSDFSFEKNGQNKDLGKRKWSSKEDLVLTLKKNPKLIQDIKKWSQNPNLKLIGFKLTSHLDSSEVNVKMKELFQSSQADLLIHNDIQNIHSEDSHLFHAYEYPFSQNQVTEVFESHNAKELAKNILKYSLGRYL